MADSSNEVTTLGRALSDPRVTNGTHEVRTTLAVGPVTIRKTGSSWNAQTDRIRGAWSPMQYVDIGYLAFEAVVSPVDFAGEKQRREPHMHHFVNDQCACGARDDF